MERNLQENLNRIRLMSDNSKDIIINEFTMSGVNCALLACDGMISVSDLSEMVTQPLSKIFTETSSNEEIFQHITQKLLLSADKPQIKDYEQFFKLLYSGFAVLFIDGINIALGFGIQGFPARGIDSPSGEGNILGGRDGFVESCRVNMSLIRRRMKSTNLKFEFLNYGTESKTDVFLVYMRNKVPKGLVEKIKKSLDEVELETVMSGGYLRPFVEGEHKSLFDTVSTTERPDVLCAKLLEGRVGVIIDGTPFVLVVPRLFNELFQTLDDYNFKPYYATFIRWLKYIGSALALLLPAIYVAVAIHHPELLNRKLLTILAEAEQNSPFPLIAEALGTLLMYEIIREAGLRLPESIGGTVSLVGGLIIGEAAVQSGFVSLPMLTVAALSVISGLIVPDLNQSTTVLRIGFVIVGGAWGLYGISLLGTLVLFNLCASETYGFPLTAPISPFSKKAMRDVIVRVGFKKMQKGNFNINKLK
ncbi:MAG: spore germination protein [Oscillospiraceae bacterium]|jgi:spore germination protein KA|nr:spore germination protein [Oscillospiraceae bacterium]